MTVSKIKHLKEFAHDVLRQPKYWTRKIKRVTIYKDNKPHYYNRKTGEYVMIKPKQPSK